MSKDFFIFFNPDENILTKCISLDLNKSYKTLRILDKT